jgi:23S rRNA A2030 N6-methylase RlmJ
LSTRSSLSSVLRSANVISAKIILTFSASNIVPYLSKVNSLNSNTSVTFYAPVSRVKRRKDRMRMLKLRTE